MKKACGTCMFNIDVSSHLAISGIQVLCANDNEWRKDNDSCSKWKETTSGLSKKDRIDLANNTVIQEGIRSRHSEILGENKVNRTHQLKLVIFGAVLGAILGTIGTLVLQHFSIL